MCGGKHSLLRTYERWTSEKQKKKCFFAEGREKQQRHKDTLAYIRWNVGVLSKTIFAKKKIRSTLCYFPRWHCVHVSTCFSHEIPNETKMKAKKNGKKATHHHHQPTTFPSWKIAFIYFLIGSLILIALTLIWLRFHLFGFEQTFRNFKTRQALWIWITSRRRYCEQITNGRNLCGTKWNELKQHWEKAKKICKILNISENENRLLIKIDVEP